MGEFDINAIELFSTWILFKNPVLNAVDKDKFAKMPKSQQENFMLQNIVESQPLFYDIEVLAVGDECKKVTVGDHVFITMEIASSGTKVDNGKYILIRETSVIGRNVGTQENI